MLDDAGNDVLLYYSACTAISRASVRCSGRLAVSNDGLRFVDQGEVISSQNDEVWGFGDEIFPVGAFKSSGRYHVYYLAKGRGIRWGLGVASGATPKALTKTLPVISSGCYVVGGGDPMLLPSGEFAVAIVRDLDSRFVEFRAISGLSPEILSEPAVAYRLKGLLHAATIYDGEGDRWLMYYQSGETNSIHAMSATSGSGPGKHQNETGPSTIGCPQINAAPPADNRILTRLIRWLRYLGL